MDDMDKTIAPQRERVSSGTDDVTMPGKRERKPDGRFEVGDLIMKRYKVLAELGQGGMGVVYRCLDETAGIEVALKALPPELSHNTIEMEDIKDNFQLVAKLVHQNIAISKQLEKDDSNGNYYLIMECCEGEDLRRWIRRKRKDGELKLEDVLPIIQQVASALDYAHKQKIMHRDIKPGNIMINAAGDIKVLDFGLAAQIHTSMTRVSMAYHGTSGTGPYMAPEQWRGRAQGAPADQYALAVMTYEMLAGHLPFESTDAAVLKQAVLDENPVEIKNVSKNVQDAIKRAMSKEPAERFENCTDFALALSGKKVKSAKKVKKSNPFKYVVLIIFLTILGGGGYYFYNQQLNQKNAEKARLAQIIEAEQVAAAKAEKETQAKLAAEKAEKERLAKAERERQAKLTDEQLDSENAALKVELRDKIAEIKQKNYAPAQGFGQKINEMKIAFATAEEAKLLITANKKYKEAKNLADWLLKNGELRKNAESLQKQAQNNRSSAEKYEPETYANELFSKAQKLYQSAEKYYNETKFAEAKNNFSEAAKVFEQAEKNAFDNKLQFLTSEAKNAEKSAKWNELKVWAGKIRPLNNSLANQFATKADNELKAIALEKELKIARNFKVENNWQSVYDHAVAALKIDSGNGEAQKLQTEAESQLKPTLQIVALLNDKEVSTEITGSNGKKYSTNDIIKDLTENQKYTFRILYKNTDGKLYEGKLALTADWKSLQKKQIILKEYFDLEKIATDEKLGFKFSEDKRTLQKAPKNISGKYIIPAGVQTIGKDAFVWCKNLQSVTIPDSVQTIGQNAFGWCKNLQSVTIPDSVQTIGKFAFLECSNLQSVTIPDSVQTIGESAFSGCKNLQSVMIPDSVQTIGESAFTCCGNLQSVTIGNGVQIIGKGAFKWCENLWSVTIPDSVQTIGDWAFWGCDNLRSVTIPDSVKTIGVMAFYDCDKLQSVNIPDSVKTIGRSAFFACVKLQSVSIPKDTVVAGNAFPSNTKVTRR